ASIAGVGTFQLEARNLKLAVGGWPAFPDLAQIGLHNAIRWGIHLTQVATIGSVAVHGRVGGGLSADTGGTRSSIQQRAGLPGVSVPPALAGRVLLFALPREQSVAAANRPLAMCELRTSD